MNEFEIMKGVAPHFSRSKHEDPSAALVYVKIVIRFLTKLYKDQPTALVLGCRLRHRNARESYLGPWG